MQTRTIPRHERGAALLIILTIIGIGAAFLLVSALNKANSQIGRDKITAAALAQAKQALIGYALTSEIHGATRPGEFPCPDRATDGNYDGTQDSPCSTTRLGKLPWRTATVGMFVVEGLNLDVVDTTGERLWYAVSRNLVDPTGVLTLNSDLLTTAPYPWLTVRDSNGNVISNRVAAVILAPGTAIAGQDRTGATPTSAQFLDATTIGASTFSNADLDEDFIMGSPGNTFNDRLVFITIDEFMALLEKRVAGDVRQALRTYYTNSSATPTNRFYPYAAPIGHSPDNSCREGQHQGFLPLGTTGTSTCTHPNPSLTGLPVWFSANGWEGVFYYAIASACDFANQGCDVGSYLTVGGTNNVNALIITAGRPINTAPFAPSKSSAQTRPASSANDYLDSVENADGDNTFTAAGTVSSQSFNDQSIIVAP